MSSLGMIRFRSYRDELNIKRELNMYTKTYKIPTNSKIQLTSKENELLITLPHRVASGWDSISRILAFLSSILLMFLCFALVKTLWLKENITNDELFWLVVFLVGGWGALWQISILFRKKVSETIRLTPTELVFDAGVSPLYGAKREDALTGYGYLKKRRKVFSRQDLKSLVLSKTKDDELYLLTFEDDVNKNIFFAYRTSNEERKWLYETILNFYGLEDLYRVVAMDESKPRKQREQLFIWIVSILGVFFVVGSVMRSMHS